MQEIEYLITAISGLLVKCEDIELLYLIQSLLTHAVSD